ncbi:MAG: AAA family ATPase [Candidatus Dormibacteraeota bacterium]|nr:AAA family ATPase [Candidatus Dormibacteraeota bacterium]
MHVRSIALQGFKTFAQRTEVSFDAGVTALVGPNGSGKSNVVDALRWVLGETRARDLRGTKMEQVVYSGGSHRARASNAEVTIVIDNGDGRLPVDYQEVAIKRRVDRTGASDYFLNGSRVRRRDIVDLLQSTGLTTDSYAIVDQRDIESIISSTPEQRRLLIEEAAQVRGVKAKRTDALEELRRLADNLSRLQDLRGELEPRLETLRAQAAQWVEADEARRRLEMLRGSIAWEEWREARDRQRRARTQVETLTRRLDEARAASAAADASWEERKRTVDEAQRRRLARQQALGAARLAVSDAEHALQMAGERIRSRRELAAAARTEQEELSHRRASLGDREALLTASVADAETALAAVAEPPPAPEARDAERARAAGRAAQAARREAERAQRDLAAARAEERAQREAAERLLRQVEPAERALPELERRAAAARHEERQAADAGAEVARLRAELQGLESLRPAPRAELRRVGDVLIAEEGYEAALAAVLGPLVDAWAAGDRDAASAAARRGTTQTTVLYGAGEAPVAEGSVLDHVRVEPGFEALGRRLLGTAVLGRDVTVDGVFEAPGLVRAGEDPRTTIAARRNRLQRRLAEVEPMAAIAGAAREALRAVERELADTRSLAGQRRRLESAQRSAAEAGAACAALEARVPELERTAAAGEAEAADLQRAIAEFDRRVAEHRAQVRELELQRAHGRERVADLKRQREGLAREVAQVEEALERRGRRAAEAEAEANAAEQALPDLAAALESARVAHHRAERQSPEEAAELASAARELVAADEARVEARLRMSTLQGNLDLQRREVETLELRLSELRQRMPEGRAPEEAPGGKAREREMRHLERRLKEIGPVNELAAVECRELEQRHATLLEQVDDLAAARADLERLVARLREEEETRYEAVFGAVTANFQELYADLTGGGKATLRHVEGDDGPHSGLEILVQPPRKRMQQVTMLSSGERSLTSLALVLALQAVNPAPVTVFDEVDAALDDANVGRFGDLLRQLGSERQFMIITHNHVTMAACGVLYGVHLDESGCSHLVSVRLEDLEPARAHRPVVAHSA